MRGSINRTVAAFCAAAALLAIAASASAAPSGSNKVPSNQVLNLNIYAGPASPLDGGTVTVTDADGRVVATDRIAKGGGAILRVQSGRRPLTVTTSGGTIRGVPFGGHLRAVISNVGRKYGPQWVNLATSVAAEYRAEHGGSAPAIEKRVLKKLGLSTRPAIGQFQLANPTYQVSRARVLVHMHRIGGYDAMVDELATRLADGKRFPNFTSTRLERPYRIGKVASRQSSTSSVASVPCGAQTPPPASASTPASVAMYSAEIAAGTATAVISKNPSLLLTGVSGMVFSNQNSLTNTAMLSSIQNQLSCISSQIANLAKAIDSLTLISELNPLQPCVSAITTQWNAYQSAINKAALNPGDPDYALSPDNANIQALFANINTMGNTTCNSIINQTLFNGGGGSGAAWSSIVSDYEKGNFVSSDTAALAPQSVSSLQLFLQYYGTLMYNQAALMTDYFNWQQLTTGKSYLESQQNNWGENCMASPSVANVVPMATTWCQWQQNIIDVWPGNLYTDEVGGWKQDTTGGHAYALDGVAVSAVPGAWGKSTTSYTQAANGMNPSTLQTTALKSGSGTWTGNNALASYNNQPAKTVAAPYQSFGYRQVPKTAVLPYAQASGYTALGTFFSQWLGYTVPSSTGVPTACSSSCTMWQLLTNESASTFVGSGCTDSMGVRGTTYTAYSPKSWSPSSGTSDLSLPCSYKTPPIAWLVSRPWNQGGAWPAAPTITTSGVVAANATLVATGCPSSGCTWTITAGAPAGLTISSGGQLAWKGSAPGTTATIQVMAGTSQVFSAPVSLTVQLT